MTMRLHISDWYDRGIQLSGVPRVSDFIWAQLDSDTPSTTKLLVLKVEWFENIGGRPGVVVTCTAEPPPMSARSSSPEER